MQAWGGLRQPEDARCVLWVALYFVLTAVAWHWHGRLVQHPASLLCAQAVLCYFAFAGATIVHNTMHTAVFIDPAAERLWHHVLSLVYGHPVCTFVPGHNLSHHRHTQTARDPMRTTKMRFRWHLLNLALFQPTVARDVFVMDMRYLSLQKTLGRAYYARACEEWAVLAGSQFLLLALDWRRFALYVWLPHLFAQWGIVSMNMLQHDGCVHGCERAKYDGSRNFVGPVLNFLTFNNGFHTIHHLHPRMHWARLPAEHARLVRPHMLPALDEPCLARYVYRTFVSPGLRVDGSGAPMALPAAPEPADEDWTALHTPGDVVHPAPPGLHAAACTGCCLLLLLKTLAPTYSPRVRIA